MKKLIAIIGFVGLLTGCNTLQPTTVTQENFASGEYHSDNMSIDIKEDNTYTILSDEKEIDAGTWEHNDNLTLSSETGDKHSFSILKRTLAFENTDSDINFHQIYMMDAYYENDTIYMMSGNVFDLKQIDPSFNDISIVSASIKNNIEKQQQMKKSFVVLRDNGHITRLGTEGSILSVLTSDGADEAIIEVKKDDGSKKQFKVVYDCNCNLEET